MIVKRIMFVILMSWIGVSMASDRCNGTPQDCHADLDQSTCNDSYMISSGKYYNCEYDETSQHCGRGDACHLY